MKICHAHCPPEGGSGLLVIVAAAAVVIGLAVAFVVAHLVILAAGSAGVAVVVTVSQLLLHRYATIVCTATPLRVPRKARILLATPSFRELAERQAPALAQPPVITATVISSADTRTGGDIKPNRSASVHRAHR